MEAAGFTALAVNIQLPFHIYLVLQTRNCRCFLMRASYCEINMLVLNRVDSCILSFH